MGILSCDHPLVGLDTEGSEVVQRASHPLILLPLSPPRKPYPTSTSSLKHHAFLVVSCSPYASQTPRTLFTSHAISPRCSRPVTSQGCQYRKLGIRCSGSVGFDGSSRTNMSRKRLRSVSESSIRRGHSIDRTVRGCASGRCRRSCTCVD